MNEIIESLRNSGLILSSELYSLINNSKAELKNFGDSPVNCRELLDIYKIRAENISKRKTDYSEMLLELTKEFMNNLEKQGEKSGKWYSFSTKNEYGYFLFLSENGSALGCIKAVSKQDVTPEKWAEMWGVDA